MTTSSALSVALVILSVVLLAMVTLVGFAGKRYFTKQDERDKLLQRLDTRMELLNQGASVGAQALVRQLSGRIDLLESKSEETDDRLHIFDMTFAVLKSTVDGHIATPRSYAHPPPSTDDHS